MGTDQNTRKIVVDALKEVFGESDKPAEMKVLVRRIPILCSNVEGMHKNQNEMKETLQKIDHYIEGDKKWKLDDANWKSEFDIWKTQTVTPLVTKESNTKVVNGFIVTSSKYITGIVTFILALFALWNYIFPLFKLR